MVIINNIIIQTDSTEASSEPASEFKLIQVAFRFGRLLSNIQLGGHQVIPVFVGVIPIFGALVTCL